VSLSKIERIALSFKPDEKYKILKKNIPLESIYKADYFHKKLLEPFNDKHFCDLKTPFYPVATDLLKVTKKQRIKNNKKLYSSSASITGILALLGSMFIS